MVQLRRNHSSNNKGLVTTFRLIIFLIIAVIALVGSFIYYKKTFLNSSTYIQEIDYSDRTFLPSATGEIVFHKYYTLSYVEKYELAEWTAYMLNKDLLIKPNVDRFQNFIPDYNVSTRSSFYSDYANSGYNRGHLVPAGDMAFDTVAMRESFYMSNITPQHRAFNNGIWKELEENIRDWTYKSETLYIITGPVLTNPITTIGIENRVTVPSAFYKVIMDYSSPEKKGIAFIIPNELSVRRLEEYMCTIDDVERATGLDFFNEMINDVEEEKLESIADKNLWKVSEKRYQLRLNKWNYE